MAETPEYPEKTYRFGDKFAAGDYIFLAMGDCTASSIDVEGSFVGILAFENCSDELRVAVCEAVGADVALLGRNEIRPVKK